MIQGTGMAEKLARCQSRLQWWESEFSKWGKSCQITRESSVLCTTAQTAMRISTCICKQTSRPRANSDREEIAVMAFWIKSPLAASRQSIIHQHILLLKSRRGIETHFPLINSSTHLTFDLLKHLAAHKSLSAHSPLHTGRYSVSVAAHKPSCRAFTLTAHINHVSDTPPHVTLEITFSHVNVPNAY